MNVLDLWPIPAVLLVFLLGVWIGFRSAIANERINGLIDAADYLAEVEAEQDVWDCFGQPGGLWTAQLRDEAAYFAAKTQIPPQIWPSCYSKAPAPGMSGAVEGSPPGMSPHKLGGEQLNNHDSHNGW